MPTNDLIFIEKILAAMNFIFNISIILLGQSYTKLSSICSILSLIENK